jgi:hypothetical protein
MVRARNSESRTEISATSASRTLSRNRSIRTVSVMKRAFSVVMIAPPPGSGAAAVMTGCGRARARPYPTRAPAVPPRHRPFPRRRPLA